MTTVRSPDGQTSMTMATNPDANVVLARNATKVFTKTVRRGCTVTTTTTTALAPLISKEIRREGRDNGNYDDSDSSSDTSLDSD